MLNITSGYKTAIVGDVRRMLIKAILEIVDPDITYGYGRGSGQASFSRPKQIHDMFLTLDSRYCTAEHNRWLLDGSFRAVPDDPQTMDGQIGFVGKVLSGNDGAFPSTVYAELTFSNVSILQACSVFFSQDKNDGIPVDFTVSIFSGSSEVYRRSYTGNTSVSVSLDGFTVYDPTSIRVTVTKWSLPSRRLRVAEIVPGVYEEWTEDILASLDIQMRGNFSCLSIPYGTCTLRMDNLDRRFEPRNKSGIFQSIEERQAIPVSIGCELEDGTVEYKRMGVFYQANGGWKTGDNDITMQWDLVDIVGLLADREFKTPSNLPTTLSSWLAALVGQLGANFEGRYHVDPDYADAAATVNSAADVEGKKCGDILRWVCMATNTWPRADAETGELTVEPLWSSGNKYDLDNMVSYPVMKANDDLAVLTFQLYDDAKTVVNISGNATSSSKTLTVSNPFIHTAEQARNAAKQILSQYGGIKLETTGRGDPASEIGDVDTVWLDESNATTGRRMEQSFMFSNGVLRDCKSVLLQADGSFMFQSRQAFTESGTFTVPSGVTKLRLILIGKGGDGTDGADGSYSSSGADGIDGAGGLVWAGTININEGQTYAINIDANSTFGAYSSANGKTYENGYTDIASGDSFARTGVSDPKPGTGDGGAKGIGGSQGVRHRETNYDSNGNPSGSHMVIDAYPGKGTAGVAGATGCVVIYWDKEEAT